MPYLKLIRSHHWIKNLLILAPSFFAFDYSFNNVFALFIGFVSFSFLASSIYIFNDILDIKEDRLHPEKRHRPLAEGRITVGKSIVLLILLITSSLTLGLIYLNYQFITILIIYLILNILYSWRVKKILIIDIMFLASGFVLRVIAGGQATDTNISAWLMLCTFFAALLISLGKRKTEINHLSTQASKQRSVLSQYSEDFLNQLLAITSAITIISYSLYTVENPQAIADNLLLTIPFVTFGIFYYFHLLYNKKSKLDPTQLFLHEKILLINTVLWLSSFIILHYIDFSI